MHESQLIQHHCKLNWNVKGSNNSLHSAWKVITHQTETSKSTLKQMVKLAKCCNILWVFSMNMFHTVTLREFKELSGKNIHIVYYWQWCTLLSKADLWPINISLANEQGNKNKGINEKGERFVAEITIKYKANWALFLHYSPLFDWGKYI